VLLLFVMAAVAPGARGWVAIIAQDSIDMQVADAELVVRARVGPLKSSLMGDAIEVEVIEVLKGSAGVGQVVRLDVADQTVMYATAQLQEPREGLFLLRHSEPGVSGRGPFYWPLKGWPEGFYLFDGGRVSAWDRTGKSDWVAHRMDGRRLTGEDALMTAAREAAAVVNTRPGDSVTLIARDFPPTSPLRSVAAGRLRVPVDERLERMAVSWLDEADVRCRARAAEVLAYFRTPANVRRLRKLAWDPGYELESGRPWEAARDARVKRIYPARAAAATVLASWGIAVPADVAASVPHGAYRPVAWGAVGVVVPGVIALAVAFGRRGDLGRRVWIGAWLAAAIGVAAAGVRNRGNGAVVSWAVCGASYELVSAGRDVWLLRVADGARAAGVRVRTELAAAGGRPWFSAMLVPAHSAGGCGLWWSDGDVAAGPTYQMVSAPYGAVVGVLMLVPAWALAHWAARKMRRRRRARRGRCTACGYDLRASSGRCPECGVGANMTRARAPAIV
jgi:hypothetical protein